MSDAPVILSLQPQEIAFSHEWRTNVMTSVKGKTTRNGLYSWPRVKAEPKFVNIEPAQSNWLKRNLLKYGDSLWAVPLWWDFTKLTSPPSGSIIQVESAQYRHFYEGRDIILISAEDWSLYEVATIATGGVSATQLTLTSSVSSWPTGTHVCPLYDFRMDPVAIDRVFRDVETFTLNLTESFETIRSFDYTIPTSPMPSYLSHDVLDVPPSYPLSYSYDYPVQMQQSIGLGYGMSNYDNAQMSLSMSFVRHSKQAIGELLDFFDSKLGMLKKFWVPTFSQDLVVTSPVSASDTTLDIQDIEYPEYFLDEEVINRHIYIKFLDTNHVERKIVDADSGLDVVALSSAVGTDVSSSQLPFLNVSFLSLVRFSIDELRVSFDGGNRVARMDFEMEMLLEETE
jgi:hypothetical protein